MKNIIEHFSDSVTTTATCFKLELKDKSIIGFTNFDNDLIIDGILYRSGSGFEKSSVEVNTNASQDNLNIIGILNSHTITEKDLLIGKYNGSSIEIFIINYNDLSQGKLILKTGFLSEIKVIAGKFHAEVYGLSSNLSTTLGQLYSPTCRATFGDERCKVDLSLYTKIESVTKTIDDVSFVNSNMKEINNYYDNGNLVFITGENKNISSIVKSNIKSEITIYRKMPFPIKVGDKYKITTGCDKEFFTCTFKFKNSPNFRGEPHVPGNLPL